MYIKGNRGMLVNKSILKSHNFLNEMVKQLDLPKSVEEKVHKRYYSLAEWFNREECSIKDVDIRVQGSFGQGTTIRPIDDSEEYDLDMSCTVNIKEYKKKYSQEELMKLVKHELDLYKKTFGIQEDVEEKNRCLRLNYQDEYAFHLDFVPGIPLVDTGEYKQTLLNQYREDSNLAKKLAKYAVNIPDKENENYKLISNDWHISNQQGYLLWLQSKMVSKEDRVLLSSVSPIPKYQNKTVLQRCIQLLKRHRDNMYCTADQQDSKPISIIITTLAARAYKGEQKLDVAILNILNTMESFINSSRPRIPNPIKPEEDFTDKWDDEKYAKYHLKENFYIWLNQAKRDFNKIVNCEYQEEMQDLLLNSFSIKLSNDFIQEHIGLKVNSNHKFKLSRPEIQPWSNR